MLGGTHWNPSEPVQICPDPFEPVETRYNPFRPVETRSDLLKHVQTCWNTFPGLPPSPPSPSYPLPLFPFLWGGKGRGEGRGEGATTTTAPRKGGGTKSPPPPDFNKKLSNFSHSFFSLLCNLPTLEVSLSVHSSKLLNFWRPLNKTSLWHTSKNKYYMYIPPK